MNTTITKDFFAHFFDGHDTITVRFLKDRDKTGTNADATSGKYGIFSDLLPVIQKQNKKDFGAYFVVNDTGSAKTGDADVQSFRALFIDIDDGGCPEYFPVEPSAVLRRSDGGGFHVYWFLKSGETDKEKFTAAQKTLIHFYKSDKVIHNPARLMRIPGTVNHKDGLAAPMYEIKEINDNRYTIDDVVLGHTSEDARRKQARKSIRRIFGGEKMADGEGRHKAFVRVSFILNDYGFTGDAALSEMRRASEKYLTDPYDDAELQKFTASQKYAKNETGGVSVQKAIEEQAKIDRMKELVKDWYYVRQQDLFFRDGDDTPVTSTGFNAKFSYPSGVANPTRFVFLNDCIKQYEKLIYDPAAETDAVTKFGTDRNMYEAPELDETAESPDWFLDHVKYIIPDKTEREHFLSYLAFLIQHPEKKIMHGMLIIGKQGIGKSIMQRVFEKIYGEKNVSAPHNENLSGAFTGWAKHCRLVVINELMQVDKKDFNNKIKPYITEPTIEVREMYKAPYTIKNFLHIVAFSNHDNALYLDNNDRRWFIVNSPAERKSADYYDALIDHIDAGCADVFHYLRNKDISAFRPGATPPATTAKAALIEYSRSDLEVWIREAIESGAAPFDLDFCTVADVRDALPRNLSNQATHNRVSKIMRDCGAVCIDKRISIDGERRRYWIVRNREKYADFDVLEQAVLSGKSGFDDVEKNGFVS